MPLFELFGDSSEGKLDSSQEKSTDLSFLPENDFAELIWGNGQVRMQGQSSRARKNPSLHGLPSYTPPSQSPKPSRDKGDTVASNIGGRNGIPSSSGKFGTFDNEFPAELCGDDDGHDDIDPWFSCPINDFLPELSGITVNENNVDAIKRNNKDSNLHSANDGQVPFPSLRAKGSETTASGTTSTSNAARGDTSRFPNSSNFVNFSHFSLPKSLNRSIGWNSSVIPCSGPSDLERAGCSSKREGPSANCTNTNPAEVKQTTGSKSVETNRTEQAPCSKNSEGMRPEDVPKINGVSDGNGGASTSRDPQDAVEPVVASSVCSGNELDGASDDPACNLKRKSRDTYDSEAPSEDVEEDSVGLRNAGPARGNGSKRGRAAEVHNLSERRRRDRINEKMRALQELIPNCNKVDKASMLDEAIEYLKTLQLQLQIMSMGAGLYMPPMMFPGGMQHMHPAHMAQFQAMGVGMASGLGFRMGMVEPSTGIGSSGFPMMQIPSPMQGGHFPGPLVSGHPAMHGAAGPSYPVMGLPGQGHPISMQHRPPMIPFPGCPVLRPGMGIHSHGSIDGTVAAPASSSKEPVGNNDGAGCSTNQTPSQECQARNGGFEQPSSVQFSRNAGDDA